MMLKFGTSGLRALVSDMTDQECYLNTRGFLLALLRSKEIHGGDIVCLAGDLRSSTERILKAVGRAVLDAGCGVENCGRIPSPALAYYALQRHCASIMVTGSHIPDDRNGIKFNKPAGEVLKTDEPGILAAVATIRSEEAKKRPAESLFDAQGNFKPESVPAFPNVTRAAETFYQERYLQTFPPRVLAGKKIVLEQHSAVGRDILATVLSALGAEVVPEGRTDYFVSKDTENVTPETRENFVRLARLHAPFAIVSTDGDSDRPFVVDERGVFYRGDELGAVVAEFIGAQAAALPISANDAVVEHLAHCGIELLQTRIGSPYVIAAMNRAVAAGKKPVVGWEVNGGFLTATEFSVYGNPMRPLPTRDCLLPILCALCAGVQAGSMSRLFSKLPQRYTQAGLLDNFPLEISEAMMAGLAPADSAIRQIDFFEGLAKLHKTDGSIRETADRKSDFSLEAFWKHPSHEWNVKKVLEMRYFTKDLGYGTLASLNFIDGVRMVFSNGDVAHIRPSGNAPQLRIYSNAGSQARADEIVEQGLKVKGILRMIEMDIKVSK